MAKQIINVGARNNDGTGDSLRVGATKVNDNFSEIYNLLGDGENLSVVSRINAGQGIAVSNSTGVVLISGRIASANDLGVIKVGENLTISPDGTLSAQQTVYSLPTASSTVLGGVKVGTGLSISQGVISSNNPTPYTLPIATSSIRGGVKIGANISVSPDGTISGNPDYLLPTATDSILGGIKIGAGLSISQGVVSVTSTGGSSDRLTNGANTVSLGSTGILTFPNGALKIAGNTISNLTGVGPGPTGGSQLEVALAKTVITHVTTNYLGDPGGPSLTSQYLVEVAPNGILNALQVINNGGVGEPTLTNEVITELTHGGFKIGLRITNDLGDSSPPLIGFSGWNFGTVDQSQALTYPNTALQRDTVPVTCTGNASTVVYTALGQYQHTIRLLIQVEGLVGAAVDADTQACEMIIAKSFRANDIAASVYGVVHTSVAPLATFTTDWNALTNRVEVLCTTPSANTVTVKIFATEITTSEGIT